MNQDRDKKQPHGAPRTINVTVRDVPASRLAGLVARHVKTILSGVIETQTGYAVRRLTLNNDGSASAILSDERIPGWGRITTEKLAPQDGRPEGCRWVAKIPKSEGSAAEVAMRVQFKSARESLMQAHGATPAEIQATVDPFDSNPPPDWYERVKLAAVRYKEEFGTVRAKHMLAVGAGVPALQDLRFVSDGPKRGEAFIALLDADLMVRAATGKALDVKAQAVESDDDI